MDLSAIINHVFETLRNQILNPLVDGLYSVIPETVVLVLIAAVISLLVGFSGMNRGPKAVTIILLFVIAVAIPHLPGAVNAALNGTLGDTGALDLSDPQLTGRHHQ